MHRPCDKAKHPSLGAAEAHVRSLKRRDLDRPEEGLLRPYWCGRCAAWHTGHYVPRKFNAAGQRLA
jgi:hypothetical protein